MMTLFFQLSSVPQALLSLPQCSTLRFGSTFFLLPLTAPMTDH